MGPTANDPEDDSVDQCLQAYEVAWRNGPPTDLGRFLPPAGSPLYLEILREIVRIDLELRWEQGRPRPLEEYLRRYPELARDATTLRSVAFEEYRQRRLAGQTPAPAEYEHRFGVPTAGWDEAVADSASSPRSPGGAAPGDADFIVAEPGVAPPRAFIIPDGRTQRPGTGIPGGSSGELSALLQVRLRLVGLASTIGFAYFAALVLLNPSQKVAFSLGYGYTATLNGLALLASVVLTLLLWLWRRMPVPRLRVIELALFGLVLSYLAWSVSSDLFVDHELSLPLAQGDHALFHYGSSWSLPFCALIISYGVLIPSTFRRCALVVSAMVLLPLIVGAAAGVTEDAFTASFVQSFLLQMALWLTGAAGIAVYGSHRLEALRKEASAARQLGQYRLKRHIGTGGMGEVYLAEHVLLRRPCAVKVIRPDRAGDSEVLRRFEREVQVLATLRHPNTVQIYDYGHARDGTFYYVMEYLPGLNLEQLVKRQGPLSPEHAIHLLLQICGALREAHAAGLVHRDVKPSNIMTYEHSGLRDVAKLLDFGLVHVPGPSGSGRLTDLGQIAGTPAYLSPEQAASKEGLDARTDVYSLGAVAYFLLTGRPPFVREKAMQTLVAHVHDPVEPMEKLRPGLPVDLQKVVMRCLEKDPAGRYPDVVGLERALSHCDCAGRWADQEFVPVGQVSMPGGVPPDAL
jgi:serine/threonine-protein kinase